MKHEEAIRSWRKTWFQVHRNLGEPSDYRKFAIFFHISHVQERLDDISTLRKHITETSEPQIKRLLFESMYQFSCQLLDQWAICIAHFAPLESSHVPYNWDFHRIVSPDAKKEIAALPGQSILVDELRKSLESQMIWLDENLSYYRNRLIVHNRQPFDRSLHLVNNDVKLFFNLSPDWMGLPRQEQVFIDAEELLPFAPEKIVQKFRQKELSRTQLVFEYMLHIDEFSAREREKVKELAMKYGCLSPTSEMIYSRVIEFICDSSAIIENFLQLYPDRLRPRTIDDYKEDKHSY